MRVLDLFGFLGLVLGFFLFALGFAGFLCHGNHLLSGLRLRIGVFCWIYPISSLPVFLLVVVLGLVIDPVQL